MGRTRQQVLLAAGVCVALLTMQMLTRAGGHSFGDLSREPTTLAGLPWWTGAVSMVVGLLWAFGSALVLVAARFGPGALRSRLTAMGLLMAIFALDDSLALHEAALPALGIPEIVVLSAYGVVGLVLAWKMLELWHEPLGVAFLVGGAALALSAGWDRVVGGLLIVEDGLKLIAVLMWILCGVWALQDGLHGAPDQVTTTADHAKRTPRRRLIVAPAPTHHPRR